MKKNYLLTAICGILLCLTAQAQFSVSYSTATYTPITNATSINNGLPWDDIDITFPLGFSFNINNSSYDSVLIQASNYVFISSSDTLGSIFIPYAADLIDRAYVDTLPSGGTTSVSPISYSTTGAVGSRVFKIEYENAGFYEERNDTGATDFVNHQIWFYETTNVVELHFGSSRITNRALNFHQPIMLLVTDFDVRTDSILGEVNFVVGDSTNPSMITVPNLDSIYSLNGHPVNGAVFTFSSLFVGLNDVLADNNQIAIYPNPAQNAFTFTTERPLNNEVVQLLDLTGKVIRTEQISGLSNTIDVSELSNGLYFLRIGDASQKVIISH